MKNESIKQGPIFVFGPFSFNSIVVWSDVSSLTLINACVSNHPKFLLSFNFVLLKPAVFDLFSSQDSQFVNQ